MSTAMGFRYLFDAGYIDREMDTWFHASSRYLVGERLILTKATLQERNIFYVVQVEIFLSKVFGYSSPGQEDEDILLVIYPDHAWLC